MNKLLLLLTVAAMAVSCDSAYDLSNFDKGDISIGGDESEFRIPLATLIVYTKDLVNGDSDIKAVFDEVEVWLPVNLPDGDYVDIERLLDKSDDYLDDVLDRLFEEMNDISSDKIDDVATLIWNNPEYRKKFIELMPGLSQQMTEEEFKLIFKEYFRSSETIGEYFRETTSSIAREYLSDLKIDNIRYTVSKIDLGDDVVNMLVDNLDPKGTPDPKYTLYLYGSVNSGLPVSIETSPVFVGTDINITPFTITPEQTVPIRDARIYAEDFRRVIDGLAIEIPIELKKYYPSIGFTADQQVEMILRLRKTGGLIVNL